MVNNLLSLIGQTRLTQASGQGWCRTDDPWLWLVQFATHKSMTWYLGLNFDLIFVIKTNWGVVRPGAWWGYLFLAPTEALRKDCHRTVIFSPRRTNFGRGWPVCPPGCCPSWRERVVTCDIRQELDLIVNIVKPWWGGKKNLWVSIRN